MHQLRLTGSERLKGSTATRALGAAGAPPLPGQWAWRRPRGLLRVLRLLRPHHAAYLIWRNLLTIVYGCMVTTPNLVLKGGSLLGEALLGDG